MKNIVHKVIMVCALIMVLASCSSNKSLQEYYVDNSENPNFLAIDVPASMLNINTIDLDDKEKEVFKSLKKLNVLAFKKTEDNEAAYEVEKKNIKAILKNDKYVDLMKVNTAFGKGVIKYLGEEDAIDEVVIYGNDNKKGFALIRVLGKNMNPAHLMNAVKLLEKSDYKGEGLEEVMKLLNK